MGSLAVGAVVCRGWCWRVPSERSETGACSIGRLVEGLCFLDVDVAVVGWHVEVVASNDRG